MRSNRIGRSGVTVTELGFGGAAIGNLYSAVDDDAARAAVDAAWDGGVRYFDTAPHYGLGLSERRLGDALAGRPRDEYAVSTKVGRLLVPNPVRTGSDLAAGFAVPDDMVRVRDYSRDGVRRSVEASLERLGLDRIDIALVHDPDEHLDDAIRTAIPALHDLRDEGTVGAVGAGMNYVAPLLRVVAESAVDAVMLAGRWTLLDRSGEALLAEAARHGVNVIVAAPFNSGILAQATPTADARFDYAAADPEMVAAARELATICTASGVALPEAALRFPLRHDAVVSVVAGMRTASEAASDSSWATSPIPEQLWDQIEAQRAGTR